VNVEVFPQANIPKSGVNLARLHRIWPEIGY
jgi:hypothetical protein